MLDIKLNLGCGSCRPTNWINIDSSINANLQRIRILNWFVLNLFKTVKYESNNLIYMNLNKRWKKFKDGEVDVVYASHLFEHLELKSADLFLSESYRCLKPGGVIRLVVPDLYMICKKYIDSFENTKEKSSDFIMWAINMHREGQYGKNISFLKKIILELQGYPHQHKYMYDSKSLTNKLIEYGFCEIRSSTYGSSVYINNIKDVEGTNESYLSVYLEAKKA